MNDQIQMSVSGKCECGLPFYYNGMATQLEPMDCSDVFLLDRPIRCKRCGILIEIYLSGEKLTHPLFAYNENSVENAR